MNRSDQARVHRAFRWLESNQALEMGSLARRLRRAAHDRRLHTSLLREVLLARHLAQAGFRVKSEVITPNGKSCDLVATRGALVLHLHVKCLEADTPPAGVRAPRVPRAIQQLQELDRRLLVEIEWTAGMSTSALSETARQLRLFLLRASVGDECVVRSKRGALRARCRVRSAPPSRGLSLTHGVAHHHEDHIGRITRLLRKARAQFLPGGENIIVLFGPASSQWMFEEALRGAPIERWDAFPRRGERVAMGRSGNGFWHLGSRDSSRIAVWQSLNSRRSDSTAWIRPGISAEARAACDELFNSVRIVDA